MKDLVIKGIKNFLIGVIFVGLFTYLIANKLLLETGGAIIVIIGSIIIGDALTDLWKDIRKKYK